MGTPVLVSGATSQLGIFLLPRLRAAGFQVFALSRRASASAMELADQITWASSAAVLGGDCDGLDRNSVQCLVSAGPLELAIRLVEVHTRLQRAVVFSTSSVLSKAGSGDRAERRQMAQIAERESVLSRLCGDKGVSLLLLRPTLIYGCGLDLNVSLLARFGNRFGFIPLADEAQGLRQPVHADDLAALAVRALMDRQAPDFASVACGGSTLTYRAMAERIAEGSARRVRVITLPRRLMSGLVAGLSLLPAWRGLNPQMVKRQGRNLVFDDSELRERLAWDPRPFEPTPDDFKVPGPARALQL